MNLEIIEQQLKERHDLLESGELIGFTTGITQLDYIVGRMKPGSIWTVGGYSGSGKSYFVLNMIEGMIQEAIANLDNEKYKRPRVVIYSTELSESEYIDRHIYMRLGEYRTALENFRNQTTIAKLRHLTDDYVEERLSVPFLPEVIGNIRTIDEIQKHFNSLSTPPDIIFVDYVQELTVKYQGKELVLEQDTMPHISAQLLKLAKQNNTCVVAVSQVNNNMANADFAINKQSPFSYGKQLNQASDTSLILTRRRVGGQYSPILECFTVKSRNGDYGVLGLEILRGFKLVPLDTETYKSKISKFIENNSDAPTHPRTYSR